MTITEIKVGQTWLAKNPALLKSDRQIRVIGFTREGLVRIERFYRGTGMRKDKITPGGLRRRYDLLHDQETLL